MEGRARIIHFLFAVLAASRQTEEVFDNCSSPLGLQSGNIADQELLAMSTFKKNFEQFGPQRGRLNSSFAYRADPQSINKDVRFSGAFVIELPKEKIVTGVATQGFGEEWVTKYRMAYYPGNGDPLVSSEIFQGNMDGDTVKFNVVSPPVKTSQVYIDPVDWHKNIALRVELYGCEPGYHFKVWLDVLDTTFKLSFMDRANRETLDKEERVLSEIKSYLQNIPGFLETKLHKFSPPIYIYDLQIKQESIIAEIEIYCIESATTVIKNKLKTALVNQSADPVFGPNILLYPVADKCHPPSFNISIGKDPSDPQRIPVDTTKPLSATFTVTADLNPVCPSTQRIRYTWEIAAVDVNTGLFSMIYPWGKPRHGINKIDIKTNFVQLEGEWIHFIRCIVRNDDNRGVYSLKNDFGFVKLVKMTPLKCGVKPNQGKAALDEFEIICNGSYERTRASNYSVKLETGNKGFILATWRTPKGSMTLPAGNPEENYNVQLRVEAKFPSLPSLLGRVQVKVSKPEPYEILQNVRKVKDLISAGKYEEAAYKIWILQPLLRNTRVGVRGKVKKELIQSITDMRIQTLRQLYQVAPFVAFSNEIKEETTPQIQNDSLQLLTMAVHFLESYLDKNLTHITDILLEGVTFILTAATEKPLPENKTEESGTVICAMQIMSAIRPDTFFNVSLNTKIRQLASIFMKRMEIIKRGIALLHKITVIRGNSATGSDQVKLHSKGISILRAKLKRNKRVFYLERNEVHLPAELLLQNGTVQVIRFDTNPYAGNPEVVPGNVSYIDVTFWYKNETVKRIYNLSHPIRIVFPREPVTSVGMSESAENLFLTKKAMRYHAFDIPSHQASVIVSIRPEKNITLSVYVRHGTRPTSQHYDLNVTLPRANVDCLNLSSEEKDNCTLRDPYEFEVLPNVTGQNGSHFLGIEILEQSSDALNKSVRAKGDHGKDGEPMDEMSCVEVKPAPTTPPTAKSRVPRREFDPVKDFRYNLTIKVASCVFWDEVMKHWSLNGVKIAPESNESRVQCLSNHLTTFSGYLYVVPNKIDFVKINVGFEHLPPENAVVLSTVCLIFVCYAVGLMFARRADDRDKKKVVNTEARSQSLEDSCTYSYQVFIQTGMWYDNGTTARVGMILFGEERNSDIIYFMDPWRESKLFTRGSVNTFTFDLPCHLGQVYKIHIWHDNAGRSPSWFLYQVGIKDLSTEETWHFVANRWLAVESPDGAIDVEVPAASQKELTKFKRLFQWRAITGLADRHLFLSLFVRPPQNPFTRCQRLTCMLSIILVSLVTTAMFYRDDKDEKDPNSFQLGPLELSLRQVIIGVQSGLIALPVNILTVMIFRNTRRNVTSDSPDESKDEGTSTQTPGFFPPYFIVVGWVICLTTAVTSGTFAILYSVQWGAEKSNRWLLSVGVSILQDILLTGPIIIIVNTSITSLINRKPTEEDEIKKKTQQANLVHVVQEDELAASHKPPDEELLKARSLKLQVKKLRRFFKDLVIYVVYVALLMIVCYADRKPSSYLQTKTLNDTFSSFYQVKDARSFWTWFEEELVPGLYESEKTLSGNGTGMISGKIGFIVGLPKIRQIRIKSEPTCRVFKVRPVLRTYFRQHCTSDFSNSNKDTTPYYKPGWKPWPTSNISTNSQQLNKLCPEPWRYKEPMGPGDAFLPYGGGGYIAKLGYDGTTALMVKKSMKENNWIDNKSAAVIVEFIVFEPANLLLTEVMLLFEKFANSRRSTRIDVIPQYIFPSTGSSLRSFYRVSILLWLILILVLFILEIIKAIKQGRAYFRGFFNWISILQILSSCCAGLTVFLKENTLKAFLQQIRRNPYGDWSPFELIIWSSFEEIILSIAVVTTTIKSLKLIQLNRHVHVMKWTLQSACRYLLSFSVIILMLSLAFAQFGSLLFGASDEEYATLYFALRTVLQMAIGIGKIQVNKMKGDSSEWFAPIYLFGCMLSLTIVFVNTFIAILDDAFHQANDRQYPGEGAIVFMKQYVRDWFKKIRNADSVRGVYRESPFRKTIRRKSYKPFLGEGSPAETDRLLGPEGKLPNKSSVQLTGFKRLDHKGDNHHKSRAKLAESESLLSYESLDEDTDNLASHQILSQSGSTEFKTQSYAKKVKVLTADDEYKHRIDAIGDIYLETLSTEEELLLCDISTIMKTVRSEFMAALWKDEDCYSASSTSLSYDGSFEELNESASMLSLIQACKDPSNRNAWSYVRGMVRSQGRRLHRNLRRQSRTHSGELRESYI